MAVRVVFNCFILYLHVLADGQDAVVGRDAEGRVDVQRELGVAVADVADEQALGVEVLDGAGGAQREVDLVGEVEDGARADALDRDDELLALRAHDQLVVVVLVLFGKELDLVDDGQAGTHFVVRVRGCDYFEVGRVRLRDLHQSRHLNDHFV